MCFPLTRPLLGCGQDNYLNVAWKPHECASSCIIWSPSQFKLIFSRRFAALIVCRPVFRNNKFSSQKLRLKCQTVLIKYETRLCNCIACVWPQMFSRFSCNLRKFVTRQPCFFILSFKTGQAALLYITFHRFDWL